MIYLRGAVCILDMYRQTMRCFGEADGKKPMRKFMRPIITIIIGLALALLSAALTYSPAPVAQGDLAAALLLQPTATPQSQGVSEIGSTDGIIAMGFLIAVIIVIPIFLQRKSWKEDR
jgi:hypothetical protein